MPSPMVAEPCTSAGLCVALRPDNEAAATAQSVARDYRELYRIDRQPLSYRLLHIGLVDLDQKTINDERMIEAAIAVVEGFRFKPVEISFDSVVSLRRGPSRPIALASTSAGAILSPLLGDLADQLRITGIRTASFEPRVPVHMTLIHYDKPVMPEHLASPIRFRVDRLWLARKGPDMDGPAFLRPAGATIRA